jgi:hypothetical protein
MFTNDDPLNATDPLGLFGGPGVDCSRIKAKQCRAERKVLAAAIEKGASVEGFVKFVESAAIVGCVVSTWGLCGAIVAGSSTAVDTLINLGKSHGPSKSFLALEARTLSVDVLMAIPGGASRGIIGSFARSGAALSRSQVVFLKAHPAVFDLTCTIFCR